MKWASTVESGCCGNVCNLHQKAVMKANNSVGTPANTAIHRWSTRGPGPVSLHAGLPASLASVAAVVLCCALFTWTKSAFAQGTVFTYQGRLVDGGKPANGSYDLQFRLADAATGGNYVGPTLTNAAVTASSAGWKSGYGQTAALEATRCSRPGSR